MGALGPETLKHKHKLPEPQILHIYGLLHRHCTGFQQEVQAALAGAEHREQLLAGIWTAFAQLWDECVQVRLFGCLYARLTPRHCMPSRQAGTALRISSWQQQVSARSGSQSAREEGCSRRLAQPCHGDWVLELLCFRVRSKVKCWQLLMSCKAHTLLY